LQLHFKTYGSGEPLIILHGLFGSLDNWQTLAKEWATDYTVIALDLRNHGRSPFADSHSYQNITDDIAELMEQNWIYKAHLLGHSMGGKAALHFATQYEDRINKLMIADIGTKPYDGGHEAVFAALQSIDLTENISRKAVETQLSALLPDDAATLLFLLKNLSRNVATGLLEWKINIPVLWQYYREIIGGIVIDAPINVPTLFLRGSRSNYITDADWQTLRNDFLNAQLVTIGEAGHWLHADNPKVFAAAISTFLGNVTY
jgi:esterase